MTITFAGSRARAHNAETWDAFRPAERTTNLTQPYGWMSNPNDVDDVIAYLETLE